MHLVNKNESDEMRPDDNEQLELMDQTEKTPQRRIYLLPNLLTTAALFAGFYSIVAAMKGLFDTAAIAIFIAMIADGLDGRVARMTNTQSMFGAQYDSLSDMCAFGIAPALVIYSWSLSQLGKLGWLAAFLYAAATALRLARFNVTSETADKRYFQGLPCPAAAAVIAGLVWLGSSYEWSGFIMTLLAALITITVAGLMVSLVRYSSFKSIDFKGSVPFFTIVLAVVLITAVAIEPPEVLFGVFMIYAASGPFGLLLSKLKKST